MSSKLPQKSKLQAQDSDPYLQISALQREKDQLQSQLNNANNRLKILEKDSTLKQKKIEDIQYQLDRSMTQSQQEINIDQLNQSFQDDEEKRLLKSQVATLQSQVKMLSQKPLDYDKEISKSVVQRQSLHSDFSSANQTIKQLQAKIDELQNQLKDKNTFHVDSTNKHLMDLEDRVSKLQIQCDNQVIQINQLNQIKLSQLKEIEQLKNSLSINQLSNKQELSENELKYTKESQILSLNLSNKEFALMTNEQKLKQTQEYLYQLQRKYDQDTLNLQGNLQNQMDVNKRLQEQLELQNKLIEQIQQEKLQLSNMYEKLQNDTNNLSFQLQQQLKQGESKYLRDSSTLQQQLTEKELRILELEKQNRDLNDKIFFQQQKFDQETYNYNNSMKELQDKLFRIQKQLDDKIIQFNTLLEEKTALQNNYLRLQEEISIQKIRYQQELTKLESQYIKETQFLNQQLNERGLLLEELEKKLSSTKNELASILKQAEKEASLNISHSAIQEDQIKHLQEKIDQLIIQNNLLNSDKQLLNQQLDRLNQNYINLNSQYVDETDNLKKEIKLLNKQLQEKQQQNLIQDNKLRQLNEEFLQLQVRFEKEVNQSSIKSQEYLQQIEILKTQLEKERKVCQDWEIQTNVLKNQMNQQMNDIRKMTESQLIEKYSQITNEQKNESILLINALNQEKQQLKLEINLKNDAIRQLENKISDLNIQSTKNQIQISEQQTVIQQQKFTINEQEAKIRELIISEFDSIRDKSADQQIRTLISEIKILQQKLKKCELYSQSLEEKVLKIQ